MEEIHRASRDQTMPSPHPHDRFALAVDCVVFGLRPARSAPTELVVLLVPSDREGTSALPERFLREGESLDDAARSVLGADVGLSVAYLEQLYTFGDLERDPRERVVSVAYLALVSAVGDEHRQGAWVDVRRAPPLALDHGRILEVGLERLRAKVRYRPIGFGLLPERFSLTHLQRMYEVILGRALDKRNFRKKIASLGFVVPTSEKERDVRRRAAQLFRFDRARYDELTERGFDLELI